MVIRLVKFLWSGCWHVWEDAGTPRACTDNFGSLWYEQPMRCSKCGARTRAKV